MSKPISPAEEIWSETQDVGQALIFTSEFITLQKNIKGDF